MKSLCIEIDEKFLTEYNVAFVHTLLDEIDVQVPRMKHKNESMAKNGAKILDFS